MVCSALGGRRSRLNLETLDWSRTGAASLLIAYLKCSLVLLRREQNFPSIDINFKSYRNITPDQAFLSLRSPYEFPSAHMASKDLDMLTFLEWYGAIAGAAAALIVSLNLGRRVTGWAFVIFVTSSLALGAWGFLNEEGTGIGVQNIVLLAINLVGVYRYLIAAPKAKPKAPSGS